MNASALRLGFLSAVLGLTLAPLAQAIPVTVNFAAHAIGVDGPTPLGFTNFPVFGSFTYENSIADSSADPNVGAYADALTDFSLVIGTLYNIVNDTPGSIGIANDKPNGVNFIDRMTFAFEASNAVVGPGSIPLSVVFDFLEFGPVPQSLFTSTALPQTGADWPSAAALDQTSGFGDFKVTFGVGSSLSFVTYKLDSFTAAPVTSPASVPDSAPVAGLLALALGAMAAGARRVRRA